MDTTIDMRKLLFALAIVGLSVSAFGQSQGVSMRATNGIGYGNTAIHNLLGEIGVGNVTNAAGSRVAYLTDIGGAAGGLTTNWTLISLGNDTNTLYFSSGVLTNIDGMSSLGSPTYIRISTNGALLVGAATNIDFVSSANTTVTGGISGATAIIGISSSGGGASGDIYVTNGYVTNIFNTTFNGRTTITSNLYATNIITTNFFAGNIYSSNAFITNLYTGDFYTTNAFITNLFAGDTYTTNLYVTNLFAGDTYLSNAFITNLFAGDTVTTNLFVTNLFAGDTYVSNAYITNLTVVGLTGLTNNTSRAGIVVGSGIGTNLTDYARLSAATNNFTGDLGVNGTLGTFTATANSLDVTTTIHGIHTNLYAIWDDNGFLIGTNSLASPNFINPTNTAVVGQVIHATSTAGATKWDYVNQALTNSNPVRPDFSLPVNYFGTNDSFLFLDAANVDTTGKKVQVTDVIVTNAGPSTIDVTFDAAIHVTGTANVTNVTIFHFMTFADLWSKCTCEPIF